MSERERKINLEEIIRKYNFNCNDISLNRNKNMMLDFAKQLLELASENAKLKEFNETPQEIESISNEMGDVYGIDKQSILDTIKLITI